MNLWNTESKAVPNGYEWRTRHWSASVWEQHPGEWHWELLVPLSRHESRRFYATARSAKLAMERTVKRLGIQIPGRKERANG